MKIISNYHDYYDSLQGYAVDDDKLVYSRIPKEILIQRDTYSKKATEEQREQNEQIRHLALYGESLPSGYNCMDKGVIGFCGKAYPFYQFEGRGHYDIDTLIEVVGNKKYPTLDPAYTNNKWLYEQLTHDKVKGNIHRGRVLSRYGWDRLCPSSWNEFLLLRCGGSVPVSIGDEVFMYFKSPIIHVEQDRREPGYWRVTLNPRLNQYSFASQVDPYTAYQELSMYVGNNLATQMDPNVNISDELKRDTHGFNEWSFKTHPTESKKPRGKSK